MSRSTCIGRASLFLTAASLALGCDESIGVRATGPVQVTIQRTSAATAQSVPPLLSVSGGEQAAAPIDLDNVQCLVVEVIGVHLLPAVQDPNGEDEGAWVRLAMDPLTLDLKDLPQEGDAPVVIVFDPAVPAGDYGKLRLITGAVNEIFFIESFSVGPFLYEAGDGSCTAGEGYMVQVPSGSHSGLKTDVVLSVGEAMDPDPQSAELLFDETTSIRNAVATGNGRINLTPVLRIRP